MKIFLFIFLFCTHGYSQIANDPKKIPDSMTNVGTTCSTPFKEARGTVGGKEVCILTSHCKAYPFFSSGTIEANVNAYCQPNDSNRCPAEFTPCFTDTSIKKVEIDRIVYRNIATECYPSDKKSNMDIDQIKEDQGKKARGVVK